MMTLLWVSLLQGRSVNLALLVVIWRSKLLAPPEKEPDFHKFDPYFN